MEGDMTKRTHTIHRYDDGTYVLVFLERVNYSPMTKWEATPSGEGGYGCRRFGRTRAAALAAALDAWAEMQGVAA
jgi:hypothetical protein